jgi:hypothetical protein
MAFAKAGLAPGETQGAQVRMFDLRATQTPDEFMELIKEGVRSDTDPKRFDTVKSSTDYTNERAYPCVRHHGVYNDKEARTSPTSQEPLILEVFGLYCRHPVRTNSGFAAIYSYRGRTPYGPLEKEARDFIQSVQVPLAGAS